MKKSSINNSIIISAITVIFLLTFCISNLSAQSEKKARLELKENIKTYVKVEILPNLKQWKSQLDNSLSSDDLAKLNDLRKQARAMMEFNKNKIKEKFADNENFDKKSFKSEMKLNRKKFQELAKQVKPIADNNQPIIEKILGEAIPLAEDWKDDILDIIEEWKDNNPETDKDCKHKGHFKFIRDLNLDFMAKKAVVKFMLWDGDEKILEDPDENLFDINSDFLNDNNKTLNYPNPFQNSTTINFNLEKDDNVTITVSDNNGNLIKTIYNGFLKSGEHTFNFSDDEHNLSPGTYIYTIKTSDKTKTGKMILNK